MTNIDIYIRHYADLNQKNDDHTIDQHKVGVREAVNILNTTSLSEAAERFAVHAQKIRKALNPS